MGGIFLTSDYLKASSSLPNKSPWKILLTCFNHLTEYAQDPLCRWIGSKIYSDT
jgi:hypothetical protein